MKAFRWIVLFLLLPGYGVGLDTAASALEIGEGRYEFVDQATGKTIPVWYYKPTTFDVATPILFVMHGMKRTAEAYRNTWVEHAEKNKWMLLVPELSAKDFPGDRAYNLGNVYPKRDEGSMDARPRNPVSEWSFMLPERIFDDFGKNRERTRQNAYYLYGHSAGSQFVHRLMLFVPEARVRLAVCVNAGSYTVPDHALTWPYGLKNTDIQESEVRRYLGRPMAIVLGEADNDPNAPMLTRSEKSDKQGTNRFDRGQFFFTVGQKRAEELKTPFGWQLRTVPGVAHGSKGSIDTVAALILEDMTAGNKQGSP